MLHVSDASSKHMQSRGHMCSTFGMRLLFARVLGVRPDLRIYMRHGLW